jgi:hypothetical protein
MTPPLLPLELQLVAAGTLLAFFSWVVYLVRSHRLSLRDSLLWIVSTAAVFVLTLFPRALKWLAHALAIEVPSNALFALAILYLTLNVLSLTIALSNSASRARRLTQEAALLRGEVEALGAQVKRLTDELTRSS